MTYPTLTAGVFLKGEGFDRAFALNTVQAYIGEGDAERGAAAYERAVERGHETAWAVNPGSSITDHADRHQAGAADHRAPRLRGRDHRAHRARST